MNWFESWFDTEYYHLLYKHRNDAEAKTFLDNLVKLLGLTSDDRVADIGCGKGRHSMVLAEMGLKVWGMDLSSNSIQQAEVARKELGYANLEFCVHDMRQPYPVTGLSAVFNLFTSFGYFDDALDDTQALVNMHSSLKEGGYLVQDYLNATPLLNNSKGNSLQELTWSEISGVRFGTEKWFENGTIFKRILVSDHRENQGGNVENQGIYGGYFQGTGGLLEFREEVKVYSLHDLINLHTSAGFAIESVHGSYDLMPFSEENSPRMIVVSKKI